MHILQLTKNNDINRNERKELRKERQKFIANFAPDCDLSG